jgi:N-acetylmuramoyl-L-alanine amidase
MLVVRECKQGKEDHMKIGIDPGHGGQDPGAVGLSGSREKDVNLAIAQRVQFLLNRMGLKTVMSRSDDISMSLPARSNLFNNSGVDYAVSIHCNSSHDPAPNYISTYIQAPGGAAERLADKVQKWLVGATGWKDGRVRIQNLHMTRETRMPAILCECGFISNPAQEAVLNSREGQTRIARAIAAGLGEFLDIDAGAGESQPVETWKQDIMDKAIETGLITAVHQPDDIAPKWFVLQVALNSMAVLPRKQ